MQFNLKKIESRGKNLISRKCSSVRKNKDSNTLTLDSSSKTHLTHLSHDKASLSIQLPLSSTIQRISISLIIARLPTYQLTIFYIKQSATSSPKYRKMLYLSLLSYSIKKENSQRQSYAILSYYKNLKRFIAFSLLFSILT